MKRFLAIVLTLCMLISMSAIFVSADAAREDEFVTSMEARMDEEIYRIAPEHIFPFVYTDDGSFDWYVENVLGPGNYEDGYLYVKNFNTGSLVKICDEPVLMYDATKEDLFYLTTTNKIYKTDFEGDVAELVYTARTEDISNLYCYMRCLYFIEGAKIVRFDLQTRTAVTAEKPVDVDTILPYDNGKMILWDSNDQAYDFNILTKTKITLASEYEAFSLMGVASPGERTEIIEGEVLLNNRALNDLISFPLPEYPDGSYFNNGYGMCDHLNQIHYCKSYAGTDQCEGFAAYAHDRYAHVVDYSRGDIYQPAGCAHISSSSKPAIFVGSEESARSFFRVLEKGTYVRFGRTSTHYSGFHSIAFDSILSNGIQVYECNQDYQCGVRYGPQLFSAFNATRYHYVVQYVEHLYVKNCVYSSPTYHKAYCSGTNCNAYSYVEHSAYVPGPNATCAFCGYIGNITIRCPTSINANTNTINIPEAIDIKVPTMFCE